MRLTALMGKFSQNLWRTALSIVRCIPSCIPASGKCWISIKRQVKNCPWRPLKYEVLPWVSLKSLGLMDYFDIIVTADDVVNPKPAPDCVNAIIDFYGCPRGEAILSWGYPDGLPDGDQRGNPGVWGDLWL